MLNKHDICFNKTGIKTRFCNTPSLTLIIAKKTVFDDELDLLNHFFEFFLIIGRYNVYKLDNNLEKILGNNNLYCLNLYSHNRLTMTTG